MSSEYARAAQLLRRPRPRLPVYDSRSIYKGIRVPQYNLTAGDYVNHSHSSEHDDSSSVPEAIRLLLLSAAKNYAPAHLLLAESYMYGNHIPVNYTTALTHYAAAAELSGDPQAYFMLGHAAATGLFGEVPVNPAMAILYYELAAKAGSPAASLVLAYRYSYGLDVPRDCFIARHHYSRVAHLAYASDFSQMDHAVSYNIGLQDFSGGFYSLLSEYPSSVRSIQQAYDDLVRKIELNDPQMVDHQCMRLYTKALLYALGDYFVPRNSTLAFDYARKCVEVGESRYAAIPLDKNLRGDTDRDAVVLCLLLLGNMYLRGQGTPKNLDLAKTYLERSLSMNALATAVNGFGMLHEQSNNASYALILYANAANVSLPDAMVNFAKLTLKQDVLGYPETLDLPALVLRAADEGNTEALLLSLEYVQADFVDTSQVLVQNVCASVNLYYKMYIERFEEQFFPSLKFAFDEIVHGNYKNALLAYLIAAEQGMFNAQTSAAYLLYQVEPLFSLEPAKTFSDVRVKLAIAYLEKALYQMPGDATVLLGDIYFNGVPGTSVLVDHNQAYKYYKRAAQGHSAMGSYNLARMYEYGLGPLNNSTDYFMAKRYYDLSAEYSKDGANRVAISFALLRLRFKHLFNKPKDADQTSWLGAFKTVKSRLQQENPDNQADKLRDGIANQIARLQQQHVGALSLDGVGEGYDMAEMVILAFTTIFFVSMFVRSFLRHFRNRNRDPNEINQDQQNGNMRMGFNLQGINFEFHVAI